MKLEEALKIIISRADTDPRAREILDEIKKAGERNEVLRSIENNR
jgi:hypothetical protein